MFSVIMGHGPRQFEQSLFTTRQQRKRYHLLYDQKKKSVCHVTEFLKMPYLFFVFLLLEAQKPQVVTAKRSYLVVGKAILQDLFEEFRLRAFLVVILHECTG